MLWIRLADNDHFINLAQRINEICNITVEKQQTPHITLARVKGKNITSAALQKIAFKEIRVTTIELLESTLTPKGPVYNTLASYSLSGKS